MKNIAIIGIILFYASTIYAQKEDYVWAIGYESTWVGTTGETIDFNFNPPKIDSVVRGVGKFRASSAMCDSSGNLLFYTNGRKICNKTGTLLSNSNNLTTCDTVVGCYAPQSTLILPYPNHPNQYILFAHNYTTINYNGLTQYVTLPFRYSIIDATIPQGIGTIIQKNLAVLLDTTMMAETTACRHANGRDWWILVNKHQSTIWYRMLVSASGVQLVGSQDIGFFSFERGRGQTVFSPDGNIFAIMQANPDRIDRNNYIELFQFDRCSGVLTQKTSLTIPDTVLFAGIAISPNSRFLYACTEKSLHQFDLQSSNIPASKIKIASNDNYITPRGFPNVITVAHLAPNNKIYTSTISHSDVLGVINNPDNIGLSCNFTQHSVQLPTIAMVPNYPNFRLGRLRGSSCDTLSANNEVETPPMQKLRVFPNPVSGILKIDLTLNEYNHQGRVAIVLYDVLGKQVRRQVVGDFGSIVEMDVSGLAEGVYVCGLEIEGRVVGVERVVVQRN
jgi:hypothetical protein